MRIGGLQKTSLLDYPDCISAIVWMNGCNFRCPFCYNKELVFGDGRSIPEDEVLSFLSQRKGMLEAVVISGGEPLLQDGLIDFLKKIKELGFLVKVDTNGSFPESLNELFEEKCVDYIAMDVKAPKEKYEQLTGAIVDLKKIEKSIDLIKTKAPAYEFRTTFVPSLLKKEDMMDIAVWLEGANQYYLQQFKIMSPLISSSLEMVTPYPKEYLLDTLAAIKPFFKQCAMRGI